MPMKWLRWAAVVPSAILGWYVAFVSGLALLSAVERLCPREEIISGLCGAGWYANIEGALIKLYTGLSAFLAVTCAAAASPSHRVAVAWAAYAAGVVMAFFFVWQTSAIGEFAAAIVAGLLGVVGVARYPQRP